jgi:hypothetical protein
VSRGAPERAPRLRRPIQLALALGAVRVALAAAGIAGATMLGLPATSAALAIALGAGLTVFAVAAPGGRQRPTRFPRLPPRSAQPLWRELGAAMYPSTYGVALLTAIALVVSAALAAILAGVLLGLGLAALADVLLRRG